MKVPDLCLSLTGLSVQQRWQQKHNAFIVEQTKKKALLEFLLIPLKNKLLRRYKKNDKHNTFTQSLFWWSLSDTAGHSNSGFDMKSGPIIRVNRQPQSVICWVGGCVHIPPLWCVLSVSNCSDPVSNKRTVSCTVVSFSRYRRTDVLSVQKREPIKFMSKLGSHCPIHSCYHNCSSQFESGYRHWLQWCNSGHSQDESTVSLVLTVSWDQIRGYTIPFLAGVSERSHAEVVSPKLAGFMHLLTSKVVKRYKFITYCFHCIARASRMRWHAVRALFYIDPAECPSLGGYVEARSQADQR